MIFTCFESEVKSLVPCASCDMSFDKDDSKKGPGW